MNNFEEVQVFCKMYDIDFGQVNLLWNLIVV
jgi:hypothetical protein